MSCRGNVISSTALIMTDDIEPRSEWSIENAGARFGQQDKESQAASVTFPPQIARFILTPP